MAFGAFGFDQVYPVVTLNLNGNGNWTRFRQAVNAIENRIDFLQLAKNCESYTNSVVETNGNVYSRTWSCVFTNVAYATNLFRWLAVTNSMDSSLSASVSMHMCPRGPATNPPPWGPCYNVDLSGYISTNR